MRKSWRQEFCCGNQRLASVTCVHVPSNQSLRLLVLFFGDEACSAGVLLGSDGGSSRRRGLPYPALMQRASNVGLSSGEGVQVRKSSASLREGDMSVGTEARDQRT